MSANRWDAAVIGGGPAGCSAAITLAQSGLRVAMLEAKTYPHDKMCGEFLSPECTGLLAELGLGEQIHALGAVPITRTSITASDGTIYEEHLPGTALGLSRKLLDAALAERARQAGVEVFERAPVGQVQGNLADGFVLDTPGQTLQARAVIGAHGKRSTIDRVLKRRFLASRQPFVAVKAHFHGPPIPGRIELHAFPGGYCGMSEIEGGSQVVCLLVREEVFQRRMREGQSGIDGFIHWMGAQNIYLRSWLHWAERIHDQWITIAQVPFVAKPIMERDILMAGDAAGLITPLAGNGIAMALEGGRLAARHLADCLSGVTQPAELRRAYPRAWRQRFGARLRWGRALQPLLMSQRGAALALRLLNRLPVAGRYLIQHTRGIPSAGLTLPAEPGAAVRNYQNEELEFHDITGDYGDGDRRSTTLLSSGRDLGDSASVPEQQPTHPDNL